MVPSLGTLFSIPPPRRRGNLESCFECAAGTASSGPSSSWRWWRSSRVGSRSRSPVSVRRAWCFGVGLLLPPQVGGPHQEARHGAGLRHRDRLHAGAPSRPLRRAEPGWFLSWSTRLGRSTSSVYAQRLELLPRGGRPAWTTSDTAKGTTTFKAPSNHSLGCSLPRRCAGPTESDQRTLIGR